MRRLHIVSFLAVMVTLSSVLVLLESQGSGTVGVWPLVELGPAIVQDSYTVRVPMLESPFGMIGDVPGGYSLYLGNPLQGRPMVFPGSIPHAQGDMHIIGPPHQEGPVALAVAMVLVPLLTLVLLGRRSYGAQQTRQPS
ncbi:MAG: hypothetical protein HXY34_08225 [Candidatus Thorarchaeota archaeon]|nr:hypothetical protein [Candidatus Thorarchaeota archaeon]